MLPEHNLSQAHQLSSEMLTSRKQADERSTTVAQMQDSRHAIGVTKNREHLKRITTSILFLASHTIALRGHDESAQSLKRGNFRDLPEQRSRDIPDVAKHVEKQINYTSPDIQNEIIKLAAQHVVRKLMPTDLYAIVMDETTDSSRLEQVSICLRYVGNDLAVHEHFFGFFDVPSTGSELLFNLLKKTLSDFGLDPSKLVGQCYDGAANMSGAKSGLATRVKQSLSKSALNVHCWNHQLNLSLEKSSSAVEGVRDVLHAVNTLHSLIEGSAKRHALFMHLQSASDSRTLKLLSETRWASRHRAFKSLKHTFAAVLTFLDVTREEDKGTPGSVAKGLIRDVRNFDFVFHLLLMDELFEYTHVLTEALQREELDIMTAKQLADS